MDHLSVDRPPLPVEHLSLGGAVPAYMAALGIVAAAIVVALLWKSPAGPADRDTANATIEVVKTRMRVGRITRMYDCRWVNEKSAGAASVKEWLTVFVGSKYVIDGGLMEITYDTGTKVVLKGPVVYEVDSSNGGYLRVGTAAVLCRAAAAKNAGPNANTLRVGGASTPEPSLFCVHTPHSGRPTAFSVPGRGRDLGGRRAGGRVQPRHLGGGAFLGRSLDGGKKRGDPGQPARDRGGSRQRTKTCLCHLARAAAAVEEGVAGFAGDNSLFRWVGAKEACRRIGKRAGTRSRLVVHLWRCNAPHGRQSYERTLDGDSVRRMGDKPRAGQRRKEATCN